MKQYKRKFKESGDDAYDALNLAVFKFMEDMVLIDDNELNFEDCEKEAASIFAETFAEQLKIALQLYIKKHDDDLDKGFGMDTKLFYKLCLRNLKSQL